MNTWPDDALALLMEHGASAVCVYDPHERIVRWNPRYVEFFPEVTPILKIGLHFVDTVRPFLQIQHPRMPPGQIDAEVQAALLRHRQVQTPVRYQRADDGRWLELRMFAQPGGGRIKIWNDVTAQQLSGASHPGVLELMTQANVGLIVHDESGALAFTNSRYFSEMFLVLLTVPPDIRQRGPRADYWPRFEEIFRGDATYESLCTGSEQGALAQPATLMARTGRWFRIEEQPWRGGIASIWTEVTDLENRKRALQAAYAQVSALNDQLRDWAETDSLTGLPNRRRFDAALALAQARAEAGTPCHVAVVDIDHFKSINDGFGHGIGDAVLVQVAACMRQCVMPPDVVARLGGEEFGVVFHDVDGPQALRRAQALCAQVAMLACDDGLGGTLRVTISAGTAALQAHTAPAQALRSADLAMFEAKREGRNRAMASGGHPGLRLA